MTSTLFSTRDAIAYEKFLGEHRISAGHRLLDEAVGPAPRGTLWVVRGPALERGAILDGIAAASLIDRRSITYSSLLRPTSGLGLDVVACAAKTSAAALLAGVGGEPAERAVELSETRLFDVVGSDLDMVETLPRCAPPLSERALDLMIVDGADIAPRRVVSALGTEDFADGSAGWMGSLRHYARRYRTTVIVGTGADVLHGKPDPDIGDSDVLIDVGWYYERELEFPVTVTYGRFARTRLFASWIPGRNALAWRPAPDRT